MPSRRIVTAARIIGLCGWALGLGTACEESQGPGDVARPTFGLLPAMIVSEPATAAPTAGLVYVSLAPGSIVFGDSIAVTVRGQPGQLTMPLVLGGFDPVPLQAAVGDTLDLAVFLFGELTPRPYITAVPAEKPPVIVRTDPPPSKPDVPLNAFLRVIFSEPLDPASVSVGALQLSANGVAVAGTIAFADPEHLVLGFTPSAPLSPGTTYTITVTNALTDLAGDSVTPMSVVFATALAPPPEPVFTTLEVMPTDVALTTAAPGNTVQLSIQARDQTGAPMSGTGAATYVSSAPAIVGVSSSGVVTAAAPGTAVITTTLTLGDSTHTASTTVTVYTGDYSDFVGVFDVTALITSFDPAWGVDLTGYRYTAVLTLEQEAGPPGFGGTFADLWLIGPAGDSTAVAATGVVTASIGSGGRVVIDLFGSHNVLTLVVPSLASGFNDGLFGCCGHISGTFAATRRP